MCEHGQRNIDQMFCFHVDKSHRTGPLKCSIAQDGCFGENVWKDIQQAFEPYIRTRQTLQKQEFTQVLEGNHLRTNTMKKVES